MKLKRFLYAAIAGILCLGLAACGSTGAISDADQPGPDGSPGASGDPSGSGDALAEETVVTLTENWDFSSGFYPIITSSNTNNYGSTYWEQNFYDTLVCYDENGEIQGGLAESWVANDDGLTYTFTLRDGVKFSDGTDLTAAAVKTSIEGAINNLGQFAGSFGKVTTIIDSMEAPDDKTFVITLTQPYYGALNDLTMCNPMGIVNPAAFDGDPYEICAEQTMGTGPYMYAGDFDGNTYTFVRNPHYWGEVPEVDGFKVKVIEDNDAKVLALRNGEIDGIIGSSRLSYDAYSELSGDSSFGVAIDDKGTLTRYLGLNLAEAPFDDVRVRQAIAYALDKETLSSSVFQGIEQPADKMFMTSKPYCDVEQETYSFDLDTANELMDGAGWLDSDGDGIREKDGQKLELEIIYSTEGDNLDDSVLAIASQLAEIGFSLTPKGADIMTWLGAVGSGEYDINMYQTYGGAYDPTTLMTNMNSDVSQDPGLFLISSFFEGGNDLILELDGTSDAVRVREIYAEVLGTIAEQALIIPVSYTRQFAAWSSDSIIGYDFYPGSRYVNVANIHVE